jgi:regulator of sigma E protease
MLLIVLHELGHFAAAKAVGMRVERFSLFFPPLIARKQIGETEYALGALPIGGYVKITGMNPDERLPEEVRDRAYHAQPVWKRMVVIAAGPGMNFVLALVLLIAYFWAIGPRTAGVDRVETKYPAAGVLHQGDVIKAVDGRGVGDKGPAALIAKHRCAGTQRPGCRAATPVALLVDRDGHRLTLRLFPIYDPKAKRMRVGFSLGDTGPRQREAIGGAVDEATTSFGRIAWATVKLPAKFFNARERKQIHGPVGNYEYTRQTILHDPADTLGILAILSLALAIVNLFPFLPLDGGHIFWAGVEKLRGRPVPLRVMERSGVLGMALVLAVFAIALTNDIDTLSGKGFHVR